MNENERPARSAVIYELCGVASIALALLLGLSATLASGAATAQETPPEPYLVKDHQHRHTAFPSRKVYRRGRHPLFRRRRWQPRA